MRIESRTLINDYQALRGAAQEGSKTADISLAGRPADLVSNRIDNDPATLDEIVASSWSGSFSDSGSQLTYREQNNRLEFSVSHCDFIGAPESVGTATVDLASGAFVNRSNGGGLEFVDGAAVAAPPAPKPSAQEQQAQAVRESYSQLREAIAEGRNEVMVGMGSYTIVESGPGYVKAESWGGSMSDPTCSETFKEVDGKLEWTKLTPGSPWMVGSQDETVTLLVTL